MAVSGALLGGIGAVGSSIMNGLSGSTSSGGSVSNSWADSWSNTYAADARQWSAEQAAIAFERQKELQKIANDFNREEAEKARNWEAEMANTIYTRSVKNMREAGINPILAANMGLSGANVGSGAVASAAGAGSAPLAQNFMDSASASQSQNHGSSWNSSESGLATGLALLGEAISGAIGRITSSNKIDIALNGLENLWNWQKDVIKDADNYAKPIVDAQKNAIGKIVNNTKDLLGIGENKEGNKNGYGIFQNFHDKYFE